MRKQEMARKFHTSPARRGLVAIASGAAAGQVILVAAAPLLGRLYGPDAFGAFSVVNAVVIAIGTIAALRFELAVPLPDSDAGARGIVRLGSIIALGVAVVGTPVAYLTRDRIAALTGWSVEVVDLLVWAPVGSALLGMLLVLTQLAVRQREYRAIALRNVLQASATVGLQTGFGLLGMGSLGLVLGLITGQAVGVVTLAWRLRRHLRSDSAIDPKLSRLLSMYRSFPLILAPSGLINTLGLQAPLLAISSLYGAASAGHFGMAQRVVGLPVVLVGVAIGQVFVGEMAARKRGGSAALLPLFMGVSKKLAAAGVAAAASVFVAAPWLFSIFLGEEWETSGRMARALTVGLMVQLVAVPVSQATIIAGKNLAQLLWDIGRLVICVMAVIGAERAGLSDVAAVWWLAIATALTYAASWFVSRWAVLGLDGKRRGP